MTINNEEPLNDSYRKPAYRYEFGGRGATTPTLDPAEMWSCIFYQSEDAGGLRTECLRAAQNIARQATELGQPIRLHLSGGDDSKMMIWSFIQQGIDFKLTTRSHFMQGKCVNQADVDAALLFAAYIERPTDMHIIEDLDLRWGDTEHRYFLDMTALSARLGWERYPDEFNVLATTPYLMTGGPDDWELLPTFSMSPNFLHSFFLDNPNIMQAQLEHEALCLTRPARMVLEHVANSVEGAHRWAHLRRIFAYEQIVKPILARSAWPELEFSGRPKNTGFDDAPLDMNTRQPEPNERYRKLLLQKVFPIPVWSILDIQEGHCPVRIWKDAEGKVRYEAAVT